jgi:uncharacterized membrane protein YeaQ/YmgE (transglycosylase-associated protein family)
MGLFHIIWAVIVGFFTGLIARYLMSVHMGVIATMALGIVGSFVGGFLSNLIWKPKEGEKSHPAGFIMSVIGAIIVLFVASRM